MTGFPKTPGRKGLNVVTKVLVRVLVALLVAGFTIYFVRAFNARTMIPLSAEHKVELLSEFQAGDEMTWRDYLANEKLIERELLDKLVGRQFQKLNRHAPKARQIHDKKYNRSFSLSPSDKKGAAVLLHGLSDSPYSMRSTAEVFHQQGFETFVPRLPGHGYAVGALRYPTWQDWYAVVKIAMTEADAVREPGQRLVLGGYSNGGILSLKYSLACQNDSEMVCPDAILLLSPAIEISPFALFANWNTMISWLPYFEQFQWTSVYPEIDPYKFTSFPKSPGWETVQLANSVNGAISDGDIELPPILAFQSVVDATVNAKALLSLFEKLSPNNHRLVFYDINRHAAISEWLTVKALNLDKLVQNAPYEFSIDVISNLKSGSDLVEDIFLTAGQTLLESTALQITWPDDIYSLSHIAIPFPPDDPVYGRNGSSPGAQRFRGERKVLHLGGDYFLRLRFNPFFAWQKEQITMWLQLLVNEPQREFPPATQ
jgi:alpha-beta hydrolase superfamily lysophospholipase